MSNRENYRGVFNQPQHQEEVDALLRGLFKQFTIVSCDLGTPGLVKTTGNPQGVFEVEGCGLCAVPFYMNNDGTFLSSFPDWPVMVRFNHPENPWLPIGMPGVGTFNGTGKAFTVPCSYALTFGRFWLNVPGTLPIAIAGNGTPAPTPPANLYLAILRGVSIYSGANSLGPEITMYTMPTWTSLR